MSDLSGSAEPRPFGPLRSFFWPIHTFELKKLLPMLLMFFFISLVYSLLRNTKDTLIVTAPGGGAGLIPFLKVYGTIPGAVLFMLAYMKLSSLLGKETLFYASIGVFIVFFTAFAFVFPVREAIHPIAWTHAVQAHLPMGFANLLAVVRHWVLSLFYVMAELWGSVALSLLFWGFANDITRVSESKRFYALFGLGANLALVAVQFVNQGLHPLQRLLSRRFEMTDWTAYILLLMAFVVLCALAVLGLYRWMHAVVLKDPRFRPEEAPAPESKGTAMGLREGLRFLLKSRYLLYIAILVMAYGIAINLVEVTWKSQLGLRYPNPQDYQDFMATFATATGLTTLFLMLFVSSNVIRRFGWKTAALITPVVLLATGVGFFTFTLFKGGLGPFLAAHGTTPLAVGVLFGTVQNVMSKASKYALFDPTKEMAYIPLDQESKVKGKAAIDVTGARLGKAGGSIIQQVLIAWHGSLAAATGSIAVLFFLVIALWLWGTVRLGRAFNVLSRGRS